MSNTVEKYRLRRAARLGISTIYSYSSVEEYRRRRKERLEERFDAEGYKDVPETKEHTEKA